jgi:hypothetical protein
MNALSQISQITQLVVEIGAGAEPHLQACIDALRNLKEPKLSPECGVCGERFPIDDFEKHLCADFCKEECDECGKKCRKEDLLESEVRDWAVFCEDCFNTLFLKCELCCEELDREQGEWLSVSLEQPLRRTKTCSGVIVRELCLECVQTNIEDFTPEFKTDEFAFIAEGCVRNDDISSVLKDHAKIVAEMKWCVRCDLCPQDEDKKNDKNWCSECWFQFSAIDEEEEEEEVVCASCCATRSNHNDELCDWEELCKCGKPLYDMLLYYKEGTFCKCREEEEEVRHYILFDYNLTQVDTAPNLEEYEVESELVIDGATEITYKKIGTDEGGNEELCENCDKNPIAPKVLCGFEKWCEVCDTALYSTKIDFVK